ncbi:MAG: ribonuclease HI family protein [Oligoflexia bacterium]|nr:ribonuclease HI family protein [Oligoflexia bacterium]
MSKLKLPEQVIVYTDGASRGNPGPASFGFVITNLKGDILLEGAERLGERTNNYAEYMGMLVALNVCKKAGVKRLILKADSQLMVRQMIGEYKVKAEGIIPLFVKANELVLAFKDVKFEYIPREQNKIADKLANQALDG